MTSAGEPPLTNLTHTPNPPRQLSQHQLSFLDGFGIPGRELLEVLHRPVECGVLAHLGLYCNRFGQ